MTESSYKITDLDNCLIFTITRSKRLNAVTADILDGLTACVNTLENESRGRGLIVTGEGDRAFCAGTDLFELQSLTKEQSAAKTDRARALFVRLNQAPFISIAAVNGLAFGGGLELALACLFRISAPHASYSLPEVKLGLVPAYGGTQLLPLVIGPSRALDMMLTGRTVTSDEASQMGLVNRIATKDQPLLAQAMEYLGSITQFSQVAINAIRECVAIAGPALSDNGLDLERRLVNKVGKSEDSKEGVNAFREKRAPVFKHR